MNTVIPRNGNVFKTNACDDELMAKSINNLEKYKAKRSFAKTPEPKPIVKKGEGKGNNSNIFSLCLYGLGQD